jgi:hypothetical protein
MSDWYYAKDNQQQGPINESELVAKFANKELPTDTLVWKDGLSEWTRASLLQEFTLTAPPPRPPAVAPAAPAESPAVVASEPRVASPEPIATAGATLKAGDIFSKAFAMFKKNWLNLSLLSFVYFIVLFAAGIIPLLGILIQIAVGGALILGFWKCLLAEVDEKEWQVGDLFSCFDQWLMAGLAQFVVQIIIGIGMLLLIVPGIIAGALLLFWPPLVLERKIPPFDALKVSMDLVKPHLLDLAILLLINFGIAILGVICLGVGIIPAFALIGITWAVAYRTLIPQSAPSA